MEGRYPFPPSSWKTERLNEKTTDPVFIVILGCEKHVQLLICVYLAVLSDIMLRALLSNIVNSTLFCLSFSTEANNQLQILLLSKSGKIYYKSAIIGQS